MTKFIPSDKFKVVVEYIPLFSIDIIPFYKDKVLLGKRINKPAKGYYFTTGGIVKKNESIENAKNRILKNELGIEKISELKFIGVFEHFYEDSIFDDISTHYINHGYLLKLEEELMDFPLDQHEDYKWFSIDELLLSDEVHKYVKDYFIKNKINNFRSK